jgi:hypothetical protein
MQERNHGRSIQAVAGGEPKRDPSSLRRLRVSTMAKKRFVASRSRGKFTARGRRCAPVLFCRN